MIIDITGIKLVPGNSGADCPGNGSYPEYECCCEECDFLLCCTEVSTQCNTCSQKDCPRQSG